MMYMRHLIQYYPLGNDHISQETGKPEHHHRLKSADFLGDMLVPRKVSVVDPSLLYKDSN